MDNHPLEQFMLPERIERIDSVLQHRTRDVCLVLDNIRNEHNISAVIRSADAFGIQDLHVIEEQVQLSKGVALGTQQWISVHNYKQVQPCLNYLQENDYQIVVLQPEGHSEKQNVESYPVFQLPFDRKLALVFGNEHKGVSQKIQEQAAIYAHIPMYGFVESLNISVAAAITLFCSTISKTQREKRTAALDKASHEKIRETWLKQSVKNSDKILDHIS